MALASKNRHLEGIINNLNGELRNWRDRACELEVLLRETREEKKEAEANLQAVNQRRTCTEENIRDLKARESELEISLKYMDTENQRLSRELWETKDKLNLVTQEREVLTEESHANDQFLIDLNRKIGVYAAETLALQRKVAELEKKPGGFGGGHKTQALTDGGWTSGERLDCGGREVLKIFS